MATKVTVSLVALLVVFACAREGEPPRASVPQAAPSRAGPASAPQSSTASLTTSPAPARSTAGATTASSVSPTGIGLPPASSIVSGGYPEFVVGPSGRIRTCRGDGDCIVAVLPACCSLCRCNIPQVLHKLDLRERQVWCSRVNCGMPKGSEKVDCEAACRVDPAFKTPQRAVCRSRTCVAG
jgi:hypothetical protein